MNKKNKNILTTIITILILGIGYLFNSDLNKNLGLTQVLENIETKSSEEFYSQLENTENFKENTIEHIFEGGINPKGYAVGYHSEAYLESKSKIVQGTRKKENANGVYAGDVIVNSVEKTSNDGESTFFPKSWKPQEIINKINEAYDNKILESGNLYIGETEDKVYINLYIDEEDGKIISAFPVYEE